jgi:hypothetical protein
MMDVALMLPGFAAPQAAQPHALHRPDRAWPQTNCSVDLMIQLVAADGFDPVWMLAFTVTQDFEGDHFTFFKVPSEDLEALYGLCIQELAVWDCLEHHVAVQLQQGRLVLVEVDGHHLPDTVGVTYQTQHGKTTIGIFALDVQQGQAAYVHNETRGVLKGADYAAIFSMQPAQLMPYCEMVKRMPSGAAVDVAALAWQQLRKHWQRRPASNPFVAYANAFAGHMPRLQASGSGYFHAYAFNTLRQVGANFGLMASFLEALAQAQYQGLDKAAQLAQQMANDAKVLQFRLARAVARQRLDELVNAIGDLGAVYDQLMAELSVALSTP